jgi:ABC-type multidrug transport system fused ATPase/permease subunit
MIKILLKKSKIIIFDESIFGLNHDFLERVQSEFLKETTMIIISHDIKEIKGFDFLLKFNNGGIDIL